MHFTEWKYLNVHLKFHWSFPNGSNWQYASIDSDNGLVPNRRQAIIWTNNGLGCQCIYASLGLNESKDLFISHQIMNISAIRMKMKCFFHEKAKCEICELWLTPTPSLLFHNVLTYRKISNVRHTKSKKLNDSRLVLHLSLPNILKPGVK